MKRRTFLVAVARCATAAPIAKTGEVPLNPGDLAVLAWTMWGEARGESWAGQIAVAATVFNRVARTDRAFIHDTSISAACLRPGQFSCWEMQDLPRHPTEHGLDAEMLNRASFAYTRYRYGEDRTLGSTHYHVVGLRERWTRHMTPPVRIGGHQFYRAPRDA